MGKPLFFAAIVAIFACAAYADFSMRSLGVYVDIAKDGGASVEERLSIVMNTTSSSDLYDATRSAYSDIATWQNRTGLSEMRHHISRAKADVTGLRVTPQAIDHCNPILGECFATVIIDYSIPANDTGSGLVKVDRYKPRTALYTLQTDALSFDQTKSGDLVLPEGTNITFSIPQDAENIYFSSPPQNIADEGAVSIHNYSGKTRQFTWNGDLLPNFQFTYEIESPLEDEVIGFFADSQNDVMGFFFGPEGLAAIFLMAAAVVSAYYLNKVNSK